MAAPPDPVPSAPAAAPRVPFRRRSRLVAWAKVLLPLAALALLSTVFLLARAPGGTGAAVPFAHLREIASDPRIEAPRLAGVAEDGTALALSAESLRPLAGRDAFALAAPRLEATASDGGSLVVEAATGTVDGPGRTLSLSGGVRLSASGGIMAEAPALRADLRAGTLAAEGPVAARGLGGEISAGGLRATRGEHGAARLVFNGGVRLLYLPPDEFDAPGP